MGWRENMGVKNLNPQEQKSQKEQKPPEQTPFAIIAPFALEDQKTKTDQTPPPDLSRIQPEHVREYTDLWYRAHKLADYVDGGEDTALYPERAARLPELNELVKKMRAIENRFNTASNTDRLTKIPGLPDDLIQAPAVWIRAEEKTWTPDTCPAKCKATGKCYGIAYFDHKPGKALDCQQDQCPWME